MSTASDPLVQGLGDEVLVFVCALLLVGLISLAWLSSAVRERPRVEAILLQPIRPGLLIAEQIDANAGNIRRRNVPHGAEIIWADGRRVDYSEGPGVRESDQGVQQSERSEQAQSEGASEEVPDGSVNRQEDGATAVAAVAKEEADETEESPGDAISDPENVSDSNDDLGADLESSVRIRLKFLNDTHREVEAPLSEEIGRFKLRHFASDLANNKSIRLIFNGQVLSSDAATLRQCGLFDNCVVHCLVSQPQQQPQHSEQRQAVGGLIETDELDLSHICYPLMGSVLVIVWWCQLVYSHYFSFSSSVSLVALTILFMVSITNTYLY